MGTSSGGEEMTTRSGRNSPWDAKSDGDSWRPGLASEHGLVSLNACHLHGHET